MAAQGDVDLEDLKYFRTGYQDLGRKSDGLLKDFLHEIPGDGRMPTHWHYRSLEHFQKKYGSLGMIVWASATNSQLLLINGQRVLRIWMDVDNSCWIDLSDTVASELASRHYWVALKDIPKGNVKKSKPFDKRIQIDSRFHVQDIVLAVKRIYGLDQPRLLLQKL